MAGLSETKARKLGALIGTLPARHCASLLAAVERDKLGGGGLPHAVLIEALRDRINALPDGAAPPRTPSPQRVFFEPYEDLFTTSRPTTKTQGRIARASLDPIWRWLHDGTRRPNVVHAADRVLQAVLAGDDGALRSARTELYKTAEMAFDAALSEAERERTKESQLVAALGSETAFLDLKEIAYLLPSAFEFLSQKGAYPRPLGRLSDDALFDIRKRFIALRGLRPHHGAHFLIMLANRFAKPWHALAVSRALAAAQDPALAGAQSDVAIIETTLFDGMETMARALERDAERAIDAPSVFGRIDRFVELCEGVLAEAVAGGHEPVRRRALAVRDVAADAYERLLERSLSTVRQALPLRRAGGSSRLVGARPDVRAGLPDDHVLAAIEAVRLMEEGTEQARALGRDEVLKELRTRAQAAVRAYIDDVISEIRAAEGDDRSRAAALAEGVLEFGARLLDDDEADLLRRRAEAAARAA
ncbi:MAG: hypothetical protein AAFR11_07505 [Pseudomonadota bacterium]